jgi:FkbM family methyltransferase
VSKFILTATDYGPMIVSGIDTGVGCELIVRRCHEPEVVDFGISLILKCHELYGSGVTVADIGANVGSCTIPWGKALRDGAGTVMAYEPQEKVFYCLAGNIVLNNLMNVHAKQLVISDFAGIMGIPQMNFNMPGNYGGLHLNEADNQAGGPGQPVSYKPEHMLPVRVISIDDEEYERLDIMKIDVEGMEPEVIAGAINTIRDTWPVIIAEFMHCGSAKIVEPITEDYDFMQLNNNVVCFPKCKPELIKFATEYFNA